MKHLTRCDRIILFASINPITHDRMAQVAHHRSDLVQKARVQIDLDQARAIGKTLDDLP